jgi:hypothetical protein
MTIELTPQIEHLIERISKCCDLAEMRRIESEIAENRLSDATIYSWIGVTKLGVLAGIRSYVIQGGGTVGHLN